MELTIDPYQPFAAGSSFGNASEAYEGWKSSRRGGCIVRATGPVAGADSSLGLVRASRSEYSADIVSCLVRIDTKEEG